MIDPEELEQWNLPVREATLRPIGAVAGLERLGAHCFEAEPGQQLPLACHYHEEQEELLYVLSGTLTAETPEETFEVSAGEAFVVEPGSPQRTFVDAGAEEPARVLAVGAPRVDDVQVYEP